jgi:hypothetical protein
MPHVISWLQEGNKSIRFSEEDSQLTRDDLKRAIEFEDDAYEITRSLDDMGWGECRSLINLMDRVESFRRSSHKYFVEKWVLNNGVQPKAKVGETVGFKHNDGKQYSGTIISILETEAKYLVFCPDLGHVKKGTIGVQGTYLPYEDVKVHSVL